MEILRCSRCDTSKPSECFFRNSGTKRGYHTYCKECTKEYDRAKYPHGKPRHRTRYFQKTYGMSLEDWKTLFDAQGGVCAICGVVPQRPVVDHCHNTGKVRGILCDTCNRCMGLLKDDPDLLMSAAAYLVRHQGVGVECSG